MLQVLLLYTLLACCSDSFAQYVLTQPPSVSVSLDQNVQITCLGNSIEDYSVNWYQQKPGMAPVLIIYADDNRPSGISERFSGSNSGNTARLTITRARAADEADYYCQVYDGSTDQRHSDADRGGNRLIMFWPPLLSLLVLWCTGSDSQPVLTQPPSASVSPGKTVKLSCVMSSGFGISDYYMFWYQQKPGNPPRYLLNYKSDSDKGQGSGVPSRFSGSKDTSVNTGYLTITGALAEDEADYYCATYHGSGSTYQ
ncbi:UNVERIFIED_CONTAM: hypothetical protein K2H54_021719 [Gekko kuhli]